MIFIINCIIGGYNLVSRKFYWKGKGNVMKILFINFIFCYIYGSTIIDLYFSNNKKQSFSMKDKSNDFSLKVAVNCDKKNHIFNLLF